MVSDLVMNGANVNAMDSQQRNPLMLACSSGNEDMVRCFLSAGANTTVMDKKGNF